MTAPGQWSQDNPFVDQSSQTTSGFSPDNPFVDPEFATPAVATPSPKPQAVSGAFPQSDLLGGVVAGAGSAVSGVGHFLRLFDLEDASKELVGLGEQIQKSAGEWQPRITSYKDVGSISDGIDYLQYMLGSGLASTLPSVATGSIGAAIGGKVAAVVGALSSSYVQNTGSIMEEIQKLTGEDRKALAVALGIPVAIADAVTPTQLVNRIVAKQVTKAAANSILKEARKTALQEGVTELGQELTQYYGTRLGTGRPTSLREAADRGVDAMIGGAVTGGVLGGFTGGDTRPRTPQKVDPVTLKPTPDNKPGVEPPADEVAKRQAEVEQLQAQEKATAERKAAAKNTLLRAANAWNTLTPDQRRAIVGGMADTEYNRRWSDLTPDGKKSVRSALGGDDSYTNLDTSQTPTSETTPPIAPSAQGVGPAPEISAAPQPSSAPAEASPEQAAFAEQAQVAQRDVDSMDLPSLRQERGKAQYNLARLDERAKVEQPETLKIEREFWEKYLTDIEDAMEKKLRQPPTKESLEKLTIDEGPDIQPDITPAEATYRVYRGIGKGSRTDAEGPLFFADEQEGADYYASEREGEVVEYDITLKKPATAMDVAKTAAEVLGITPDEVLAFSDKMTSGVDKLNRGLAIGDIPDLTQVKEIRDKLIAQGFDGYIGTDNLEISDIPIKVVFDPKQAKPTGRKLAATEHGRILDITGSEEKGFHKLSKGQWHRFKQFAQDRELDINASNYDLATGSPPAWETLADPNDGLVAAWGKKAFYAVLYDMGVREVKMTRLETPAAFGDIPTVEAIKRAKARVGEVALRKRAQEIAKKAGRLQVTTSDFEIAAREQLAEGEEFTIKLQPPKEGPDEGGSPASQSGDRGGPAPTAGSSTSLGATEGSTIPQGERLEPMTPELRDELASEQLIKETSGRTEDKPMGQLSVEELQQSIENYKKKIRDEGSTPGREDTLQALRELLAEKGGVELDQPTESFDSDRMDKIEQSIEDLTQIERMLRSGDPDVEFAQVTWDGLSPEERLSTFDDPSLVDTKFSDLSSEQQEIFVGLAKQFFTRIDSLDAADGAIDDLETMFEEGSIDEAAFRKNLLRISDIKRSLKAREKQQVPAVSIGKVKLPDISKKDLGKTTEEERTAAKRTLASMIQQFTKGSPEHKIVFDELNRILDYESEQLNKLNLKKFLKDESGELRFPFRRMKWGGIQLRRKAVKPADRSGLPNYEQTIAKKVMLEEDPINPYSVMDNLRRLYARVFRQNAMLGQAERLSGKKLPAHLSPYILAQMSSRFLTQAEEYMTGDGPFVPDDQGNFVRTGAPSLAKISAMVGNDVERLGWLALARRELFERAANNRTIGIDPVAAQLMYVNTPKEYHAAADALAEYHHSLVDYAVWGELVDSKNRSKFSTRFYAPIARVFGKEVEGAGKETIQPRGQRTKSQGGENPIKRYRGSTRPIVNPFETSVDWTARIIRAANQNKVSALLVRLARENPQAYLGVLEPASGALRNKIKSELKAQAELVKARMEEEGETMTLVEAEHFVGTMGDAALAIRDNVLNVWVDGKLEHWVLHPEMAYALKSLSPHELGIMTRLVGVPATVQRFGIVNDPVFIMTMSTIDTFQAFVNSKYGFIPVIDSFRGWWAAITNSEEFGNYRQGGGGASSLTSLRYSQSQTSLYDIVGAPEKQTTVAKAIHELKTYHPVDAWRTLVAPVAEAARVGEYLRARGAGASVVEAVFAAKSVTGNYSQQGGAMHALNHMTVFLNPALQVLDVTARVIARNPARWFMRASMVGIAAAILYAANSDDQDIEDLRQTPGGQRYFFFRLPNGSIGKIRKPFLEGALFASGIEAALDDMKSKNPEAFKLWAKSIIQEIAVNQLPAIGVIPAQYWANKGSAPQPIEALFGGDGGSIIPESDVALEPMFQARASTGTAARIIGHSTNTSPAVLEWLARSQFGYLGSNVLAALDGAIEWHQSGELPIPEELPFLNRVIARYPSSQVRPIRQFYETAREVEKVAASIEYMAMNEPEMLEHYIEKHQREVVLVDTWKDTRKTLAEFRRAIEDISTMNASIVPPSDRKVYYDELMRVMIEQARAANLISEAITASETNAKNP